MREVKIDGEVLAAAIEKVAVENFLAELRKEITMKCSKETVQVMNEYIKMMEAKNGKK